MTLPDTRHGPPQLEDNSSSLGEAIRSDPLGLAAHRNWDGSEGGDGFGEMSDRTGWSLIKMLAVVAGIIGLSYAVGVGETVLVVIALIGCIVLHELGHYLTAKSAGMKVTAFFVGFGPTLWSVHRGETEYGVKAIPLGGFCRIIGMHNLEEVDPADEARTYRQQPLWRRLSVALAGSAMHFLIALVVLFGMFFVLGDNGNYLSTPASNPLVQIDGIVGGRSPAQDAGFHLGDRVLAVNGQHFKNFDAMANYIEARPDQTLRVLVERKGRDLTLYPHTVNLATTRVTGAGSASVPHARLGFIGIEPDPIIHSSLGASISETGGAWVHIGAGILHDFSKLFSLHGVDSYAHMLTNKKASDSPTAVRFVSPIGAVEAVNSATGAGLATVLFLVAMLNISLGIFNLIPFLPLDGGHVAIALYEGIRSRKRRRYHADVAKMLPLFYLVIALLAFLAITAFFMDLRDII